MGDLDEVRARMAKRKMESTNQKVLTDKQFNRLYRFALSTMCLCITILGVASYAKQNPEVQSYLKENINFSKVGQWFDANVLTMIPFFDTKDSKSVSGSVLYDDLGNHFYKSDDMKLNAINSGIVTSIQGNQVIVSQDNGIQVTYGNLAEIKVGLYDHVSRGELLGMYDTKFSMQFSKGEESVSYEEALAEN